MFQWNHSCCYVESKLQAKAEDVGIVQMRDGGDPHEDMVTVVMIMDVFGMIC